MWLTTGLQFLSRTINEALDQNSAWINNHCDDFLLQINRLLFDKPLKFSIVCLLLSYFVLQNAYEFTLNFAYG